MRLSVSNLAWPIKDEDWCLSKLQDFNICGVEVAPLKVFAQWDNIDYKVARNYLDNLLRFKLEVSSLQAITYNSPNISISDTTQLDALISHFENVISVMRNLECNKSVFGSPGLRTYEHTLTDGTVLSFDMISKLYSKYDYNFLLEVVPEYYGCKFINNFTDAHEYLVKHNFTNIGYHFDTACQYLSGDIQNVEARRMFLSLSSHLHISEVDLNTFINPSKFNIEVVDDVKKYYNGEWCVLEMSDKYYTRENFCSSIDNFCQLYS